MTDITAGPGTEGVEIPARDKTPEMVSTPSGDQYICDEQNCERTFPTLQGVSMHKIRAHRRNWSGAPKRDASTTSQCTLCGKTITNARMRSHLRRVHNATEPKKPAVRRQMVRTAMYERPQVPVPPEYHRPDEATMPADDYAGGQIDDETWEERAAVVQRATARMIQLEAQTGLSLNMGAFEVADDVVMLRDKDGGLWMLRRII